MKMSGFELNKHLSKHEVSGLLSNGWYCLLDKVRKRRYVNNLQNFVNKSYSMPER